MSESKRRSPEARLADLDQKMQQLKAKKQQIKAQLDQKERKERTRRLIQIGAIFENRFPMLSEMEPERIGRVADALKDLFIQYKAEQKEKEKEGGQA